MAKVCRNIWRENQKKIQLHKLKKEKTCAQTVFRTELESRDASFAVIWYCPATVVSDEPFVDNSTL
jgi:hypothetical protein